MNTIKTSVSIEGFHGVLYPVCNRKDKVVMTLSGSEGGLHTAQKMARFHFRQGMPALAIGYFKTSETNQSLSKIPLEYLKKAIEWLSQQGYERIAIDGMSKGAEYALAAATSFQEISCVILKTHPGFMERD